MKDLNETEKSNILSVIAETGASNFHDVETMHAKREQFIDDCRFASQAYTARGRALLIGGEVIEIVSSSPALHVDAISRALRSGGQAIQAADMQAKLSPQASSLN